MAIPPEENPQGPTGKEREQEREQELERALLRLDSAVQRVGADILAIQEIDLNQSRSFHIHHVAEVARAMNTEHWAFAPTIVGTPGSSWNRIENESQKIVTSTSENFKDTFYGIGLISRVPVVKWHRLELGRSRIGLPLAVPRKRGVGVAYVQDEPRVAIIAELENGFTVASTHLSFVPGVNYLQLKKVERFISQLPGKPIILGDLNLPWNLPAKTGWKSLVTQATYPSWGAKIQFDYVLTTSEVFDSHIITPITLPPLGVSDHLPIGVEISSRY